MVPPADFRLSGSSDVSPDVDLGTDNFEPGWRTVLGMDLEGVTISASSANDTDRRSRFPSTGESLRIAEESFFTSSTAGLFGLEILSISWLNEDRRTADFFENNGEL
jgi:hypothetical protein